MFYIRAALWIMIRILIFLPGILSFVLIDWLMSEHPISVPFIVAYIILLIYLIRHNYLEMSLTDLRSKQNGQSS